MASPDLAREKTARPPLQALHIGRASTALRYLLVLSHQLEPNRAALYYHPVEVSVYELQLMALIDHQYLRSPFYGSRRMTAWLQTQGHTVNRKRM